MRVKFVAPGEEPIEVELDDDFWEKAQRESSRLGLTPEQYISECLSLGVKIEKSGMTPEDFIKESRKATPGWDKMPPLNDSEGEG